MTLALSLAWRSLRKELLGSLPSSMRGSQENVMTGAESGMLRSVRWRMEGADAKKHVKGEEVS